MDRAGLGKLHDTIPLVAGTAERAVLFPEPDLHQRIQRLDTGCIQEWNGTAWVNLLCGGVASGDFPQAEYVVMSLSDDLDNERRLQVGAGLTLVDGGANGDVTLSVTCPNYCGNGSPEGVVTALVGSWYLQRDAVSTTHPMWAKRSGSGNTGWVAYAGHRGTGTQSLAIGDSSLASETYAQSFGQGANAAATEAIAIGALATVNALATQGIAIGSGATVDASAVEGISIGDGRARGPNDIIVGYENDIGQAMAHPSVVIGTTATIGTTADSSSPTASTHGGHVVIGETASAGMGPSQYPNVVIGKTASSVGRAVIAIGQGAQARAADTPVSGQVEGRFATLLGYLAKGSGGCIVAVGDQADVRGDNTAAVGTHARANDNTTAAFGPNAWAGSLTTDGTGVGCTALGPSAIARGLSSLAVGRNAVANVTNATAIGLNALASHIGSIAVGIGAQSLGPLSMTIGSAGGQSMVTAIYFNDTLEPSMLISPTGRIQLVKPLPDTTITLPLTANYSVTVNDCVLTVNTAGGNITLSLPSVATVPIGQQFYFRKETADANTVTIVPDGSDDIFFWPPAGVTLDAKYEWIILEAYSATEWDVAGNGTLS